MPGADRGWHFDEDYKQVVRSTLAYEPIELPGEPIGLGYPGVRLEAHLSGFFISCTVGLKASEVHTNR